MQLHCPACGKDDSLHAVQVHVAQEHSYMVTCTCQNCGCSSQIIINEPPVIQGEPDEWREDNRHNPRGPHFPRFPDYLE